MQSRNLNKATLLAVQECFVHEFHNSLQMRSINFKTVTEQPELFKSYALSTKSVDHFLPL